LAASGVTPLDQAQAQLIALAQPVATETVALVSATGRWIAQDVVAARAQPARDLSAMDGYAVSSHSARSEWQIVGESAAGRAFQGEIVSGQAVRIFTGAALPLGADTIIIQENIARDGDIIRQTDGDPPQKGRHVRIRGSDFSEGDVLIKAGSRLGARQIALAAMAGYGHLTVRCPIRVAILSTGDELVPPGTEADDAHIPSTNAPMIAAMLCDWPVEIHDIGLIPDRLDATIEALRAAQSADIIVTSGGASVGDHDLIRPALLAAGATIDFWKIAMRPGKPLMGGTLGRAIVIGLPGNPVSAFVTTILFVMPVIAALSGATDPLPRKRAAILGVPLPAVGNRTDHLRGRFVDGRIVPVGPDDSAALAGLARADVLIVRPAGSAAAVPCEIVAVIDLA
jgi:molybdopterin molybdotransferase